MLDGKEEEEGEEADDDEVETGHQLEVAVLEAQVSLQELAHRVLPEAWHQDLLRPISELREHQPIHRPCRRVGPVHPPPPHRHQLQQFHSTLQVYRLVWLDLVRFGDFITSLIDPIHFSIDSDGSVYLSRDDEAREDVPEDEDGERQPHGDLDVGGQGNRHHPE